MATGMNAIDTFRATDSAPRLTDADALREFEDRRGVMIIEDADADENVVIPHGDSSYCDVNGYFDEFEGDLNGSYSVPLAVRKVMAKGECKVGMGFSGAFDIRDKQGVASAMVLDETASIRTLTEEALDGCFEEIDTRA